MRIVKFLNVYFKRRELVGLACLALLFSFGCKDIVNSLALSPEKEISFRALADENNRPVTIVYEGNKSELFLNLKEGNERQAAGWTYFEGEPGVSWTSLTLPAGGNAVVIRSSTLPLKHVTLMKNCESGILEVESDGISSITECYSEQSSSVLVRVYPFQDSRSGIIIKAACYLVIFLLIFVLLAASDWIIKYGSAGRMKRLSGYLFRPVTRRDFFVCWFVLFLIAVYIYKVRGIPNYLQVGDEATYWNTLLLREGKWDVAYLAGLFAPRGYWCYIPQTISKYAGKWLTVSPIAVWLLMPSATISWLSTIILPGIYKVLSGKNADKLHLIPPVLIMLTTHRALLTSVLMDLFGVVFLLACIYYILRFCWEGRKIDAVIAGLTGAMACSFRAANLFGVLVIALYGAFIWFGEKRCAEGNKKYKTFFSGLVLGTTAFLLVCLPQLQINLYRGHLGFLPYDHDNAWFGRSLTVWSSDYAMTSGNIAYPFMATDDQMLTMKPAAGCDNADPLSMKQLLEVYMHSPLESLMLIGKKLLIGFDQKTNIGYPIPGGGVPWRDTSGIFFSLWNYFVLFSALYACLRKPGIRKVEKAIALLIFLSMVLPETFMKIEWRYVYAGYMILYYFFTFHFVGSLAKSREDRIQILENSYYLTALSVFSFVYLTCSFTFLA